MVAKTIASLEIRCKSKLKKVAKSCSHLKKELGAFLTKNLKKISLPSSKGHSNLQICD